MNTKSIPFANATALIGCLSLLAAGNAHAYFVRPAVTFGPGELIDGLIVDGATHNAVEFNDAARTGRASVDLATGEMRLYAEGNVNTASSSGQGIMGDTLTFVGGAGTDVHFSWGLEATVDATVIADTPNGNLLVGSVFFGIFEAGLVDHTNWFGNAQQDDPDDIAPLFFDTMRVDYSNPVADLSGAIIDLMIDATIKLDSDRERFDVFYTSALFGAANVDLGSYLLDGEHTASAGVAVAPGVTVYSDSGVFLGYGADPATVALPGMLWLFAAGGLGIAARRRLPLATASGPRSAG